MRNVSIISFVIMAMIQFSCNHVYKQYDKDSFPAYMWSQEQEIVFSPSIQDIQKSYRLTLGIRHLYGFQYESVTIAMKSVSPSGKESVKHYTLNVKDGAGNYVSNCAGDMCDLEVVVDDNVKYTEAGQYKYSLTYETSVERIAGVMEVGMIIDGKD